MAGPITISIIGDNRGLNRSLDESEGRLRKLGGVAGTAGKAIGAGLLVAGTAAVGFGVAAVKSASDAQQSIGATETVFGRFASRVIKDSNAAANEFGLSANAYRENANLIGSLFRNQGVSADQLASKTKGMIGTAADLAATFGGPTSDAVAALGSAFKGEFDPLERYGISIKQSTINAELAAKGQDQLTGAALKAAQQQATTRLIMEQSSRSTGAFARETDTLAHQQQVLGASWDNIKAKAGAVLLPVLTSVAATVSGTVLPALERMGPPAAELARQIGGALAPAVSAVGGFLRSSAPILQAYAGYLVSMGQSLVANVLPPVRAAGSYFAGTFGPILRTVGNIIVGQVVPALTAVGRFLAGTVIPIVARTATQVGKNLRPVFDAVAGVLRRDVLPAVQAGAARFRELWPTIQKVIVATLKVTGAVSSFAAKVLGVVLPPVIRFAGFLAGTLIRAIVGAIGVVVRIGGAVVDAGQRFVGAIAAVGRFTSAVVGKVGDVIRTVAGIPGKVTSALAGAGSLLVSEGVALIQGLISGIISKAGDIASTITSYVIDKIPGPVRKALGIASPSKVFKKIGQQIIDGLLVGIRGGSKAIAPAMKKVAGLVETTYKKLTGDKIEPKRLKRIVAGFADEQRKLKTLARRYAGIGRQLEKAREKLTEVKDYAAGVRQTAIDFAKITGAGVLDEDGRTTAGSITQGLTERLSAIRAFTEKIQQLRDAGLNEQSIGQIIAEGVEGGMATAQALVAGGASAIGEVNDLTAQITGAAGQLGQTGASAMYEGGVAAAEALVAGLESQQSKLDGAARRIGRSLTKAIRKQLTGKAGGGGGGGGKDRPRIADAKRPKLSEEAKRRGPGGGSSATATVKLTAEQVSQLQRGKQIRIDLDAYEGAGGKGSKK